MKEIIFVSVSGNEANPLLGGPVPVAISVKNNSEGEISILMPYPNPNNLLFTCSSPSVTKNITEQNIIERSVPVKIASGSTYKAVYFLNRYLKFNDAGKFHIIYHLETTVSAAAESPEDVAFTGEFTIELLQGTNDALRKKLAAYSKNLSSNDKQRKMEAAEALLFIDNPLCIDYLIPMLSMEHLEEPAIHALGRYSSARATEAIKGMLSHKESAVVIAALAELDKKKVPVERKTILNMLASANANIRLAALERLAATPSKFDTKFIAPLQQDVNSVVREKANNYYMVINKMR